MIDGKALKDLALQYGYENKEELDKIVGWIEEGAKLGCWGDYRKASRTENAKSAIEDGYKVSDAVALQFFYITFKALFKVEYCYIYDLTHLFSSANSKILWNALGAIPGNFPFRAANAV